MNFLQPIFLVGLLAAALPIVIHMYNRRKAVRRPFPAMAFLLESNERTARSIKVRQWILLAMRALAVGLLAMALAKPFVLSTRGVGSSDRLPTAVVIVVDNSASMAHGDWWERAEDAIDETFDALRPWDEVAVIETARLERSPGRVSSNHSEARELAEALEPLAMRADLAQAIDAARDVLAGAPLPNRKIVVISDFAAGGFPKQATPDAPIPYDVELRNVRSDDEANPGNIAITDVSYTQEGSAQEHMWRIEAQVRNTGGQRTEAAIMGLVIDDVRVGSSRVEPLDAGASASVVFQHRFDETGVHDGKVILEAEDPYDVDDARVFTFRMRDRIRALMVNGEPNAIAYDDELFFAAKAMNPHQRVDSGIIPTTITPEGLNSAKLQEYDVVVLANVSRIPQATAALLEAYVQDGGGVMITLGDQVDVDAYNRTLANLLPKPLRGLKELARRGDPDAPVKITRFGPSNHQHPIFQAFTDTGGTLQSTQVFSYMLLEPSAPQESSILMTFKDNAPALIERTVGQGRVLLLTTTLDFEWTDMPVRSVFLPFLQRTVLYLARRASSSRNEPPTVGERVKLDVGGMVRDRVIVHAPPRDDADDLRDVLEPDAGTVTYVPSRIGLHRVWADDDSQRGKSARPKNRLDDLAFAANVSLDESDLTLLADETLAPWLGRDEEGNIKGLNTVETKRRVNLWPTILFLVTLALLAETIMGTRRSVLLKLWRTLTGAPAGPTA